MNSIGLARLGTLPYGQALALQLSLREQLIATPSKVGWILCLDHPPTVTLGKRGTVQDLISPRFLAERGVEVFQVDRGGEATFHGPGQLVIYPILRLEHLGLGVVDLIRGLARCLAETSAEYGVEGHYDVDHPGVWTDEPTPRKFASVGMRVSQGVTMHGVAINLVNDMTPFTWIVPCGIPEAPMTRLLDLSKVDYDEFLERFLMRLADFLVCQFEPLELDLPSSSDWVDPINLG